LPTLATVALGAALLLPLRDDRRGKRATFVTSATNAGPLNVDFGAIAPPVAQAQESTATPAQHVAPSSAWATVRQWLAAFRSHRPESVPIGPEPSAVTLAEDLADEGPSECAAGSTFAEHVASMSAHAPIVEPTPSPADAVAHLLPPLVVRADRPFYERIVPLTRLPLRSQATSLTWFRLTVPASDLPTRAERHALLAELAQPGNDISCAEALMLAYREEDVEGRMLALRALLRVDAGRGRPIFMEALRAGTDGERALAIDALVALGARDALVPAFSDRVEAIAAKAALAFVGTNVACDYRRALEPYLEAPRVEALLALLSGFLQ
jgi:hypothetical protein